MTTSSDKFAPVLKGRSVFVTGANGGLGREFVSQALERGATKIYAAARNPIDWEDPRVQPIVLDVTNPDHVVRAVEAASDVDLLINNAAIAPMSDTITGPEEQLRQIFETNFFGALRVANAFAPILSRNGGGTLLNILSVAAWIPMPTGYSASKAALWSATNALRFQLEDQKTQVTGLLVGIIDTPMTAGYDVPKTSPASVVAKAYDGIAEGALEILADEVTQDIKTKLNIPGEYLYPSMHTQLRAFLAG